MRPACAECGPRTGVDAVVGDVIYPHRPELARRWFWRCVVCGAYVGCHRGTLQPLGTCAGPELRRMRNLAHSVFDRLWRGKRKTARSAAYAWMAKTMGLTPEEAHIGLFSIEQCRVLINHVAARREQEDSDR